MRFVVRTLCAAALGCALVFVGSAPGIADQHDYQDPEPVTLQVTVDGFRICATSNGNGTLTITLFGQTISGPTPELCGDFDPPEICGEDQVFTGTATFTPDEDSLNGLSGGGLSGGVLGTIVRTQNHGETITTDFTVVVPGSGITCPADSRGGLLPQTGAELGLWMVVLGLLLTAAGASVLAKNRRRRA